MIDVVREQVLGYLLGALDDAEMEQVRARLESDESYRVQWVELRRQLGEPAALRSEFDPPPGLAERTCRLVFARVRPSPRRGTRPAISSQSAPPSRSSRIRPLDASVAIAVFFLAGMLALPAIQSSRFFARVTTCRDNLRELGTTLAAYSQTNQGRFPEVPTQGKLAGAGLYAPILAQGGWLGEARRVVCPDSPLADQGRFRIPTIDELQRADAETAQHLREEMGGSYGYCIGYLDQGVYQPTKNLGRAGFALMADAPREERSDRQSANHGGRGQNVLFEDGHVQFLASSRPAGMTDDIFANDDDLVAAGVHRDDSVIASSGVMPIIYVKGTR